jgi:hypothetical protein
MITTNKTTTFRTRVFEENGSWFFRWDNVLSGTCSVTPPLATKEDAESGRQGFIDVEKKKRPWLVFELE